MLTLYLLRHAKSSWNSPAQSDFDRPLNKRGRKDAVDLGHYLQQSAIQPELVLLSSARRTCETYQLLAEQLPVQPEVVTLKSLYGASPAEIVAEVKNHGGTAASVMVIAHNPGIEALAWHLTRDDPAGALATLKTKYPTSAMTTLTFDIATWSQIAVESGRLVDFTAPKMRQGK